MNRLLFAALLCAPLSAFAAQPCKYEAPRQAQVDLAGVRGVQVEVRSYDLHVLGTPGAKQLQWQGRACASDAALLDRLQVSQRREGDQLILTLGGERGVSFNLFGSSYASLDVHLTLPPELPLTVRVGSGDADVDGMTQLHGQVGSGDLHVRRITGALHASVGSGDIDASDIGSLQLGTVGSGDFKGQRIKGDAKVGAIGSGDVDLREVGGSVRVDTLGSGDLDVHGVGGDLSLGAKGSGDVDHSGVKGKVALPRDDD